MALILLTERMLIMDKLIYFASIGGGILLAATFIWVAKYNFSCSETRKAILFLLSGLAIAMLLIYSILFDQ